MYTLSAVNVSLNSLIKGQPYIQPIDRFYNLPDISPPRCTRRTASVLVHQVKIVLSQHLLKLLAIHRQRSLLLDFFSSDESVALTYVAPAGLYGPDLALRTIEGIHTFRRARRPSPQKLREELEHEDFGLPSVTKSLGELGNKDGIVGSFG